MKPLRHRDNEKEDQARKGGSLGESRIGDDADL
jgi:hypothetical protein